MVTTTFADLLRDLDLPKEALEAEITEARKTLPLAKLRTDAGVSQSVMADRTGVSQAAISKFEGRSDFLFSTVSKYVSALHGSLELRVKVRDRHYRILASTGADEEIVLVDDVDVLSHLKMSFSATGARSSAAKTHKMSAGWKRPIHTKRLVMREDENAAQCAPA